jgi:hypothetical protein
MDWLNIAAQLPVAGIVLVVVWIMLDRNAAEQQRREQAQEKRDAQMQTFLSDLRAADRAVIADLVTQVKALGEMLNEHDRMTSDAVATMFERTASRPAAAETPTRPRRKS